uniref:Uncharacterized protein n=1 Tax=viral metagenome TaxID=1070528 RepID=A0A6C0BMS8_9ZZZZ
MTDPLHSLFKAPLEKAKQRNRQHYHGPPAIIPGMDTETVHTCLAEIRSMAAMSGGAPSPWKKLPNGMSAGEFAFLYVHHFKERRRHPKKIN